MMKYGVSDDRQMKSRPRSLLFHLMAALGVAMTLALLGCGGGPRGTPVTFIAEPGPATLRVERLGRLDASQGEIVARGPSPLSTRLELASPAASFRVTAEPASREGQESYQTTQVRYDRESLLREAAASSSGPTAGPLRVSLPLRPQESVPMTTLVPVYHPAHGWIAVRTRMRSYRSLLEADGTAPEQVAPLSALSAVGSPERLGDAIGVWGLDIAGIDGGRIITAAFRPSSEGIELDAKDPEAAARLARVEPEQRSRARVLSGYRFGLESSELVSLRLTGLTEVRLTSDGQVDLTPAFSPDGQHVFFASTRDQRDQSDIYRRPALRAGALDVVTRNLPPGGAAWPSQAEDGTVAFAFLPQHATSPAQGHIYAKIGGLGGYDSLIVQGGSDPRISPDGRQVAYISGGDLWVCTVDGSQQRQLTTDGGALLARFGERSLISDEDRRRFEQFERDWAFAPYRDPSWSPDGRRLLYASLAGSDASGRPNYDVWLLELESGRQVQVTTNGSADLLPRFDEEGRHIYFLSNRGGQWSIWRLGAPEEEPGAGE